VDAGDAHGAPDVLVPGAPSEITTAIVALLASARPDATVTIAMFQSSDDGLSQPTGDTALIKSALRRAAQRVKAINVVIDGRQGDQSFWHSISHYPNVDLRRCHHACFFHGSGLMHNKFLLVDDTSWTSSKEHVVLQMTANWRDIQLNSRFWNSALQIWGDKTLYRGYRSYARRLLACAPQCTGLPDPRGFSSDPATGAHVALFPRTGTTDPVVNELDDLKQCARGGGIDIAMNDWRLGTRGMTILDRLETLAKRGCQVRIVVQGDRSNGIASVLPGTALAHNSHCTTHRGLSPDVGKLVPIVHSKYLLMHGTFRGVPDSTVVSTGSERFNNESLLMDDETWLTLVGSPHRNRVNSTVWAAYEANFDEMWTATPACRM
jgi:phosphatidylserine/phosphatidylglycerophosphate/cardiolipin synthase-like enzyme